MNCSVKQVKYFVNVSVLHNLSPNSLPFCFCHEDRSLCTEMHPVGRVQDADSPRLHCWSPLDQKDELVFILFIFRHRYTQGFRPIGR